MKYFLLFAFMICSGVTNADNRDYLVYHDCINKAEFYLVSNQLDSVFYYYDKVFSEYDFIFAKDALIAAQFAWKQKDTKRTTRYLIKGAGSGLRSACLNEVPLLQSFINSTAFDEQLYDSMSQARHRFNFSLNNKLVEEFREFSDGMIIAADLSERLTTVEKGTRRLIEVIDSGVFPGERIIGLNDNCKELSNLDVFYLLANYDCVVTELHDVLWEAVKNGRLHPREFASLWEWEYVRATKNIAGKNRRIFSEIFRNTIDVYLSNPNTVTNKACKEMKPVYTIFNLLLDNKAVSITEINSNRSRYHICSTETDSMKTDMQAKEGFIFFYGYK